MTALGHQLLHSDALSAELEALGLDSSLFGAAGVPAPIFQALVPRRAGVFDENANTFGTIDEPATFTRASNGIYLDADGIYQIAANDAIRAQHSSTGTFLGYLFEPAATNKCENYNFNIDAGLTNLVKSGDPAATLSRVDDSAALAAAGLGSIGNEFAVEIDNSAGSSQANVTINDATGNTNTHTFSAYARRVSGAASCSLRDSYEVTPSAPITSDAYSRVVSTGTPNADSKVAFFINAGSVCRFVGNQLEEIPVISSPIVTAGASATRSRDILTHSTPAGLDESAQVGMIDFIPGYSLADVETNTRHDLVALGNATDPAAYLGRMLYFINPGVNAGFTFLRGSTGPKAIMSPDMTAGREYRVVWRSIGSNMYVGYYDSGNWIWASKVHVGALQNDGLLRTCNGISYPQIVKRLKWWNRYLSEAETERLFTP